MLLYKKIVAHDFRYDPRISAGENTPYPKCFHIIFSATSTSYTLYPLTCSQAKITWVQLKFTIFFGGGGNSRTA